jgi:hypothetical protein
MSSILLFEGGAMKIAVLLAFQRLARGWQIQLFIIANLLKPYIFCRSVQNQKQGFAKDPPSLCGYISP